MTVNERRLLSIFIFLCAAGAAGLFTFLSYDRWSNTRDSAARYISMLEKLPPLESGELENLEREAEQLRRDAAADAGIAGTDVPAETEEESLRDGNIADIASAVRESLRSYGVRTERFRISGQDGGRGAEEVEFILRCSPLGFFRFLEAQGENADSSGGFRIVYLSIRPSKDSGLIDVTMRVAQEGAQGGAKEGRNGKYAE